MSEYIKTAGEGRGLPRIRAFTCDAMSAALADKLAKICGRFGSEHAGERATAAAMADQLVRGEGLQWRDVVTPALPAPAREEPEWPPEPGNHLPAWKVRAAYCAQFGGDRLNDWEHGFIRDLLNFGRVSLKQAALLDKLYAKVTS